MANNRMYLVFRPTGDAVLLGKRLGWGWYGVPSDVSERIASLFEAAEGASGKEVSQDDFAIALEAGEGQPHAISKWDYGEMNEAIGLRKLIIDESVPRGKPESI